VARHLDHARILMYSHDTFGLGHLRRCRAIAHALVAEYRGLSILIMSGSAIAGAFAYRSRVDFVKIPSVIKLRNADYASLEQHIDLQETLALRRALIRHTAESFQPDIFIVDKEPLGLRGEIEDTLALLKAKGTRLVLGLREVMDAPHLLEAEWKKRDVMRKIGMLYDTIWIYGPKDFYDPLAGLEVPESVSSKTTFVGFVQRQLPHDEMPEERTKQGDYILVTAGGGGDGADLMRNVLNAYRQKPAQMHKALVVLGPYMPQRQRRKLLRKCRMIANIEVVEFDNRMEELVANARAVVAMGGYNTFCEILSFDKPALIIPRIAPREEQLIRARRATELGLVDMLMPDEATDPVRLAAALQALPHRRRPSQSPLSPRMDGLVNISRIIHGWLERPEHPHVAVTGAGGSRS
jgi:predicted glycosyltransferase